MNSHPNNSFIIKTVGCKVNQYESKAMRQALLRNGFAESDDECKAGYFIINTCTVTHKADRDSRRLIRRFHQLNPEGKIIAAGCYAELDEDRKALSGLPGVAALVRNNEKQNIARLLIQNSKIPACAGRQDTRLPGGQARNKQITNNKSQITNFMGRDRAYVKIQDGCDNRCSYCKVPLVRGPSASREENEIISEVGNLSSAGYKEIVLTGVCLGAWGKDLKPKKDIAGLLDSISCLKGNFRVRMSSIEPLYVTDKLIDAMSREKIFCRHFHIPLQSGDDRILKSMGRGYNASFFMDILKKIRKIIPGAAFTTDVVVGFPGEDRKSFKKTVNFIKKAKPSRVHIFSYSKRPGTEASCFGDVPASKDVKARAAYLKKISRGLARRYAAGMKNKVVEVLIESERDRSTQCLTGYTDTYVKVLIKGPDSICRHIVPVKVIKVSPDGVYGVPA